MDFARQQRDPTKHLVGITVVVLLHVLLIYALISGLARKAVDVIKKPLTATIIEEIKPPPPPPPPPPPKRIIEPPKTPPPIETYVPPPDIPPPVTETAPPITAVTPVAPPEPPVIAPPPPPVVVEAPPPPPPPKPAIRRGIAPISKVDPEYPRAAIREGIEKGRVLARVRIDEKGNVIEVIIVSADPPRIFDRSVTDALKEWKFKPEGEKYVGEIEVNFRLQ